MHADAGEVLSIARLCHLLHQFLGVNVFFERQQNLVGIDGFDEIVCNFGANRLFHEVFLFVLGDHDDGDVGREFLELHECLQSRKSGHVLIEQNEVETALAT